LFKLGAGAGIMAKFVSMLSASSELEKIITNTKSYLFLISPSVEISESVFQCLNTRSSENVKFTLVYKTGQISSKEKQKWLKLKNISLRHLPNLHAKCFFNEESMIIGSLNLLDKSAQYSREMGILISNVEDSQMFTEALNEAKIIINSSIEDDIQGATVNQANSQQKTGNGGFCVRCGNIIPYNLSIPFCQDCYNTWSEWENPDYEESFCHSCGEPAMTAMSRPLCSKCSDKAK